MSMSTTASFPHCSRLAPVGYGVYEETMRAQQYGPGLAVWAPGTSLGHDAASEGDPRVSQQSHAYFLTCCCEQT